MTNQNLKKNYLTIIFFRTHTHTLIHTSPSTRWSLNKMSQSIHPQQPQAPSASSWSSSLSSWRCWVWSYPKSLVPGNQTTKIYRLVCKPTTFIVLSSSKRNNHLSNSKCSRAHFQRGRRTKKPRPSNGSFRPERHRGTFTPEVMSPKGKGETSIPTINFGLPAVSLRGCNPT